MNVISFPKLGLSMNVDPVAFSIGTKPIYWYAIVILTGVISGLLLASAGAKKRGVDSDTVFDICIYGLLSAIIGARIYYVAFDFNSYKDNLLDIFKIWNGGLAIYGGLIGAVLAGYIYCRRKRLKFLKVADIMAPGMILGQAIGRYGNFFNAEVYGYATSLPWGMSINGGECVHPLFLYESVWNALGLILILTFRDKKKAHGQVFFSYILWYSFGRFFLEGMRQPEYILHITENIGVSQLLAAILVIVCVFVIIYLGKNKKIVHVDGIIFDLDGTMWDATETITEPWNAAAREYNIETHFCQKDIMSVMGLTIDEIGEKLFSNVPEDTRKKLLKRATVLEAEELEKHGGKLYPKLSETLGELALKYRLFIVSNCEDGYIECFLKCSGLGRLFSDYEYIGRTGLQKSENIKLVAERNGLKNAVYVGDTKKDMLSAKAAGAGFIHAAYGFGKIDESVIRAESFEQIPKLIPFFE